MSTEPPYYTHDTSLFTGTFALFGTEPVLVRGKAHISSEPYRMNKAARATEPIEHLSGTRVYFGIKAYVLVPNITIAVRLYENPKHLTGQPGAIGKVESVTEQPKMKEQEIGFAQAWYYPLDKTIVLWEALLHNFAEEDTLLPQNPNMAAYWRGLERFLQTQCEGATRITTPDADSAYDTDLYQQFLRSLGYGPVAQAAWGKSLAEEKGT
jgi:hypothetical protein